MKHHESLFRKRLFTNKRKIIQDKLKSRQRIELLSKQLLDMKEIYDHDNLHKYTSYPNNASRFIQNMESPFLYIEFNVKKFNGTDEEFIDYLVKKRKEFYDILTDNYDVKYIGAQIRSEKIDQILNT